MLKVFGDQRCSGGIPIVECKDKFRNLDEIVGKLIVVEMDPYEGAIFVFFFFEGKQYWLVVTNARTKNNILKYRNTKYFYGKL